MRQSLSEYCKAYGKESLLSEWDRERNKPLLPDDVSHGSKKKIWWLCEKGHSWKAAVYTRTKGSGCPYCKGRHTLPGRNDLASRCPGLMAQWHPEKNAPLTPQQIAVNSHRSVWWRCEQGHEWRATVKSRTKGAACPVCANRKVFPGVNDLATTCPELAAEWDTEKNLPLKADELTRGTRRKVWWRCKKGHQWQASVASRVSGTGCPVCAGKIIIAGENDLVSMFPNIAWQWHPDRNGSLKPENCAPSSNRKVWWRCPLGHDYQAAVSARTVHSSGCPYCVGRKVLPGFNDLATLEPELAASWHPTLNGELTPDAVTAGSSRKVWWVCSQGHVWKAVINSRTGEKRCGCPVCAGRVKKPIAFGAELY